MHVVDDRLNDQPTTSGGPAPCNQQTNELRSEKLSGLHNDQSPATTSSLVPDGQLRSVSRCELSGPEIDHPTPISVRNGQPSSESRDTGESGLDNGESTSRAVPDSSN